MWSLMLKRLFMGLAVCSLTACALVPGPQDQSLSSSDQWQVGGRFAAGQTRGDGDGAPEPVAGRFAWQHSLAHDVLWLIGPLGNTLARVEMTPTGVRWQDAAGQRGEATNLRALGESLAGVVLPELPAERWLHAQWPADDVRQRDDAARVQMAVARGWRFAYRYGAPAPEGWPLAIDAAGPDGVWMRLALTEWNGISDPAEQPAP